MTKMDIIEKLIIICNVGLYRDGEMGFRQK